MTASPSGARCEPLSRIGECVERSKGYEGSAGRAEARAYLLLTANAGTRTLCRQWTSHKWWTNPHYHDLRKTSVARPMAAQDRSRDCQVAP